MFCMKCGTQLVDEAQFCSKCGARAGNSGASDLAPSAPPVPIPGRVSVTGVRLPPPVHAPLWARTHVCPNCGYLGKPKNYTQGSFLIELALWCIFLVPGLIYSIWRLSSRKSGCPNCKAPGMLKVTPQQAKQLAEQSV